MSANEPIELAELLMLQQMYLDMKLMAAALIEFEEKHIFARTMKESLDRCVAHLDIIAHELVNDAFIMKLENMQDGEI